jgi:hypothetical protein
MHMLELLQAELEKQELEKPKEQWNELQEMHERSKNALLSLLNEQAGRFLCVSPLPR